MTQLTPYSEALLGQIKKQAPNVLVEDALLMGAYYESTLGTNPASISPSGYPDPSSNDPNARSYGPFSMRTANEPGVNGGWLDEIMTQYNLTEAQAISWAINPQTAVEVAAKHYEATAQDNATILQGMRGMGTGAQATELAYLAEQPASPYAGGNPGAQNAAFKDLQPLLKGGTTKAYIPQSADVKAANRAIQRSIAQAHQTSTPTTGEGGGSFTVALQGLIDPKGFSFWSPHSWLKVLIAITMRAAIALLGIVLVLVGFYILASKMGLQIPLPVPIPA